MKNKKKRVFTFLKYGFLFFFFLYALVISYNVFFGDTIVNYGFSYALVRGEIPYNDFNLVIPLFSPFLYSLSLIITKNILMYYAMQSILLVFLFYILERMLGRKIYLLFAITLLGYPICLFSIFFPGYNFILLLLIILLIYLEREKSDDYLIGIVIGLSIITKHTIGIFLILPSLIYLKNDYKKVLKRMIGLIGPCLFFLIYLLFNRCFRSFLNLCVMGLFDFVENNFYLKNKVVLIILVLGIVYLIYSIIKRKNDIANYYVLISLLFTFPLIDDYHVSYFVFLVLVLFFSNFNIQRNEKMLSIIGVIFSCLFSLIWTFIVFNYADYKFINFSNYPFRYLNKADYLSYNEIKEYCDKSSKNIVLFSIGTENYFYKITNNLEITYFDLPNYGNYGYDSYKMMTNKFEELKDTIILVNKNSVSSKGTQQYYKELALYVVDNYEYLGEVSRYKIYYKE